MRKRKEQERTNQKLEELVLKVIETFKFYGIEIDSMTLENGIPEFNITVLEKDMKYDLNKTLDFAYWTLQKLIYNDESQKILLNYEIDHIRKDGDLIEG